MKFWLGLWEGGSDGGVQSITHVASGGFVVGGGADVSLTSIVTRLRGGWLEGASLPLIEPDELKIQIQELLAEGNGGFVIGGSADVSFGVSYSGRGLARLPFSGTAVVQTEIDETEPIMALILSAL